MGTVKMNSPFHFIYASVEWMAQEVVITIAHWYNCHFTLLDCHLNNAHDCLFFFFRRLIQSLNGDADKCPSSKLQYHQYLKHSLSPVIMDLTVHSHLLDCKCVSAIYIYSLFFMIISFTCTYSFPCCCNSSFPSRIIDPIRADMP